MKQPIDMSPEAVTGRMIALDQLWELAVALTPARDTIVKNGGEARREYSSGELKSYSNVDDLMRSLND